MKKFIALLLSLCPLYSWADISFQPIDVWRNIQDQTCYIGRSIYPTGWLVVNECDISTPGKGTNSISNTLIVDDPNYTWLPSSPVVINWEEVRDFNQPQPTGTNNKICRTPTPYGWLVSIQNGNCDGSSGYHFVNSIYYLYDENHEWNISGNAKITPHAKKNKSSKINY